MNLIISIGIVLCIYLYLFYRKVYKKIKNPLKSITFGKCIGFSIGDTYTYVLSRIEYHKLGFDIIDGAIITSKDTFNNIDYIAFEFDENKKVLTVITLVLKPEQADYISLFNVSKSLITYKNGAPFDEDHNVAQWKKLERSIYLSLNNDYLSISLD